MATKYAKDQPAGFTNRIERVVIVGAGGHIGGNITEELLKGGKHTITALRRAESKTKVPEGVKTVEVDYSSEDSLVAALKGHDMFIISLPGQLGRTDTQQRLIRAAGKAGVPFVMPNQWGSDPNNEKLMAEAFPGANPTGIGELINSLGMGWTMLGCGFWYEHSLCAGTSFFGFDLSAKTVTFYDEGTTRINVSTLLLCGRAVAALLSLPIYPVDEHDKSTTYSQWINKPLYVASFFISQRDMFDSILRVYGDKESDWKISHQPSHERWEEGRKMMFAGGADAFRGFAQAMYARVFFPTGDGNFEAKYGLANETLGLPKDDLDTHTRNAKKMTDSGWTYVQGG